MTIYQKALANGESFSIPVDGVGSNVEIVTGAKSVTAVDSGKTLVLKAAAGAAISLPAPVAGFKLKVVTGLAFATTAWTVVATAAVIQGHVLVNGAVVAGSNETTITFAHAAESIGDFVELESDGTNWYLSGSGAIAASITLA